MPLAKPIAAPRASAVTVNLPDGRSFKVAPVSAQQVRDCLELDPAEGETESALQSLDRLQGQATILFGPTHAHYARELSVRQLKELVGALFVAGCGMDAEQYARWLLVNREAVDQRHAAEMLQNLDEATIELSAALSKLPSEVAVMPMADLHALRQEIHKVTLEKFKFQAALHGRTAQ